MSTIGSVSQFSSYQAVSHVSRQQRKQDFQSIASSLSSNDLAGAKTAFDALLKDSPRLAGLLKGDSTSASSSSTASQNSLTTDLQDLSKALTAGNLGDAQSAFAKLQQDFQAARGGHHHGGGGQIHVAQAAPAGGHDPDGDGDNDAGRRGLNVRV